MPEFTPGKAVRSREPTVRVENALEPGVWRFQLVVVDDERNQSAPAELRVTVRRERVRPPIDRIGGPDVVVGPRIVSPAAGGDTVGRPEVRPLKPRRPK